MIILWVMCHFDVFIYICVFLLQVHYTMWRFTKPLKWSPGEAQNVPQNQEYFTWWESVVKERVNLKYKNSHTLYSLVYPLTSAMPPLGPGETTQQMILLISPLSNTDRGMNQWNHLLQLLARLPVPTAWLFSLYM